MLGKYCRLSSRRRDKKTHARPVRIPAHFIPFLPSCAAMRPPFGCSTLLRSLSWFFPAFGRSRPALSSVIAQPSFAPFASLRSDGFTHFVRLASLQHHLFVRHYTTLRTRIAQSGTAMPTGPPHSTWAPPGWPAAAAASFLPAC
jgi:hypothetical protein